MPPCQGPLRARWKHCMGGGGPPPCTLFQRGSLVEVGKDFGGKPVFQSHTELNNTFLRLHLLRKKVRCLITEPQWRHTIILWQVAGCLVAAGQIVGNQGPLSEANHSHGMQSSPKMLQAGGLACCLQGGCHLPVEGGSSTHTDPGMACHTDSWPSHTWDLPCDFPHAHKLGCLHYLALDAGFQPASHSWMSW